MEKIMVSYGRHDNLNDNYSNEFKYKAREIIDNIADEIEAMKDTCIISIFVELREVLWKSDKIMVPTYSININQKYFLQFKIKEFMDHDIKDIASRLNEIIIKYNRKEVIQ